MNTSGTITAQTPVLDFTFTVIDGAVVNSRDASGRVVWPQMACAIQTPQQLKGWYIQLAGVPDGRSPFATKFMIGTTIDNYYNLIDGREAVIDFDRGCAVFDESKSFSYTYVRKLKTKQK